MRPVVALCYAPDEPNSPDSLGAWGYVNRPLGKQKFMHLDPLVCEGARDVNNPAIPKWQRALAGMVLVHEAYHMRRWGGASDEAKTQCQAVRHWKVAARLLGATEDTVNELWLFALLAHYELAVMTDWFGNTPYLDKWCEVPPLSP